MDASIQRVDERNAPERASLLRGAVQRRGERRRRSGEQAPDFGDELHGRASMEAPGPARALDPQGSPPSTGPAPDPFARPPSALEGEAGAYLDVIV